MIKGVAKQTENSPMRQLKYFRLIYAEGSGWSLVHGSDSTLQSCRRERDRPNPERSRSQPAPGTILEFQHVFAPFRPLRETTRKRLSRLANPRATSAELSSERSSITIPSHAEKVCDCTEFNVSTKSFSRLKHGITRLTRAVKSGDAVRFMGEVRKCDSSASLREHCLAGSSTQAVLCRRPNSGVQWRPMSTFQEMH